MKKLKLEVGKRYVARNGDITGKIELNTYGSYKDMHPFRDSNGSETYKSDGSYSDSNDFVSPYDLISEYKEEQENMRTLKPIDAQRIIGVACSSWKPKLADKWSTNIVMNEDISVTEDDYKEMRVACTASQNELFDDIFGKDDKELEMGKWYNYKGSLLVYNGNDDTYGFWNGYYGNDWGFTSNSDIAKECIPATIEEVKSALLAEANRRGFRKWVNYNAVTQITEIDSASEAAHDPVFVWNGGDCYVYCGWQYVFIDGKWAEIISKPKSSPDWSINVSLKEIAKWKGVSVGDIRIKE